MCASRWTVYVTIACARNSGLNRIDLCSAVTAHTTYARTYTYTYSTALSREKGNYNHKGCRVLVLGMPSPVLSRWWYGIEWRRWWCGAATGCLVSWVWARALQSKATASCEARTHFLCGVDPRFAETLSRLATRKNQRCCGGRIPMEIRMLYLLNQSYVWVCDIDLRVLGQVWAMGRN